MTLKSAYKFLISGIILFIFGLVGFIYRPYECIFKKVTILYPDGISYGFWEQPYVSMMLHTYLFNITNKDDFLAGKAKMRLEEVGPYIYREDIIHHNITFNHENGTVFSSPRYTLHWVPEINTRKETDKFFLPNLAMLLFASKYSYLKLPINAFISSEINSSPIVELTAREFLFGYKDPFITIGNTILPFWITFEKIGIFDRVNPTWLHIRLYDHEGDVATTYTGELDQRMAGLFATYNKHSFLPHWDPPCDNIIGSSDGKKFGNDIRPGESVQFYRKGLCRPVRLVPVNREKINIHGVPSYLFKFDENMLDNGAIDKRNKCFCKKSPCLPKTIQDISDCFYGFTMGISFPHFLNGSNSLREPFEGLKPDVNRHDTYGYISSDTGYLTSCHARLQVNAILEDLSGIINCERFSDMVLPLAWVDFNMERIEPKINILLILAVRILPALESIFVYSSILVGILIVIYHTWKIIRQKYDSVSIQSKCDEETIMCDVKYPIENRGKR